MLLRSLPPVGLQQVPALWGLRTGTAADDGFVCEPDAMDVGLGLDQAFGPKYAKGAGCRVRKRKSDTGRRELCSVHHPNLKDLRAARDLGLSDPLPWTRGNRPRARHPGPGWFQQHQHRPGRTGVWVGRPLQLDDPSPSQGYYPVGEVFKSVGHQGMVCASPCLSRTRNTGLRIRGSVTGGRSSGSHRRLGIGRADATMPVSTRTTHSWEQTAGL